VYAPLRNLLLRADAVNVLARQRDLALHPLLRLLAVSNVNIDATKKIKAKFV
jgi:hypothetical protein